MESHSQESPQLLQPAAAPSKIEQFAVAYSKRLFAKLLVWVLVFVPLFGPALIIIQMEEGIPYLNSGPEPQAISCRQLLANGPGQNLYIDLTDFRLEIERLASGKGVHATSWERAWVPIVPTDSDEQPQAVRILLDTESVKTSNGMNQLEQGHRIRGLLRRDKEYLKLGDSIYVGSKFPNTDWKNTWILLHDKVPQNRWLTYAILGLAGFLILVAIPYWWFAWRIWKAVKVRLKTPALAPRA